MKHLRIILILTLFFSTYTFSQNREKLSALQKELSSKDIADSSKINCYIGIADVYSDNKKDSALFFATKAEMLSLLILNNQKHAESLYLKAKIYYYSTDYANAKKFQLRSLEEAKKLKDKRLMAKNFNLLGAMYYNEGKYEYANNYYNQKLLLSTELKDTNSMIETYYNMSLIFNQEGEYKKSIDYNYKSLMIAQQKKDSASILYLSEGLSISYHTIDDNANAMFYLKMAKLIALKPGNEYSLAGIYIDEGNIYMSLNKLDSAIIIYKQGIALAKKLTDNYHYSIALNCIAEAYINKKDYQTAIEYITEAEKISEQINRKEGLNLCYNLFFNCYYSLEKYKEALVYAKKGESLAQKIGGKADLVTTYKHLYLIYDKLGDESDALFYLKKHVSIMESINAASQKVQIAKQESLNEKVRQEQMRAQEKELAMARFQKQKLIKNVVLIASAILLIILLLLFRNFRQKQKANIEITEQKKIIEHKNKDILDSINYSKRIQEALLTPIEEVKKLLPNSFVLYKPKDIVSGDFYFIEPIESSDNNEWIAVAMADCTGHGVPGAFMSIMGYNFLKQSLKDKSIDEPGQALDFVSKEFYTLLRFHHKEGSIRDGMDVSFCAINKTQSLIKYSGANNPLWIVSKRKYIANSNNEPLKVIHQNENYFLYEIKATKQHVGYNENRKSFPTHTINVEKDDLIYLFTDGFADQFGGPKGKKFKYNQLANILLANANHPMEVQHQKLEDAFNNWIGNMEQVDDVSLLGIRI